jgi:hypothetical protein
MELKTKRKKMQVDDRSQRAIAQEGDHNFSFAKFGYSRSC